MIDDLRYVIRSLLRSKGFTGVTLFTLALGIGSAAAIFGVVDWVLFKASPFPASLHLIGAKTKQGQEMPLLTGAHLRAFEEQTTAFTEISYATNSAGNVVQAGEPIATNFIEVSANLFDALDVQPWLGRRFLPEENVEGHNQVVILTYDFWKEHFKGSPAALGQQLLVDQVPCTIVGVLKQGQQLPIYIYSQVFKPVIRRYNPQTPWDPMYFVFGRLRQGVSREDAEKILADTKVDVGSQFPFFNDLKPALSSMKELQKFMRPELYWVLLAAVALLYSIACLNATNLMLVRMLGKGRELGIRMALGGGTGRLLRLFLIESVLLCAGSSLLAYVVAKVFFPLFMAVAGAQSNSMSPSLWSLDWRMLGVLCGLTVVTSLAVLVLPAMRLRRIDVASCLKDGGAALGESRRLARVRGGFVVLQAAFAVVLLAGTGLMVRTYQNLQDVKLGFEPKERVKVRLGFPSGYVAGNAERLQLLDRLKERLLRVPGVVAATYGSDILLPGWSNAGNQVQMPDGTPVSVDMAFLSEGFPETAGLSLKRGKWLTKTEGTEIMINEAFARIRFGHADPVGQMIKPMGAGAKDGGWLVVGVVDDVRATLRDRPGYVVYGPASWGAQAMGTFILVTRPQAEAQLGAAVTRAIYEFDPKIVSYRVISLGAAKDEMAGFERFVLSTLKVLSAIALTLTVVGFFSVLAYSVDRRMAEFGVRMALGATPVGIFRLVVLRALWLAILGIVAGIAGALALTRFLQSILFETAATDPVVLSCVSLLLLLATCLACAVPARRAARTDITRLLRSE